MELFALSGDKLIDELAKGISIDTILRDK
jgi:hypothetical protein